MKDGFRPSMAWLHSWGGLLSGWILYFVILTGSLGYVHHEITRWMKPELPLQTSAPKASDVLTHAQAYLTTHGSDAEFWAILFPGQRGVDDPAAGWRPRPGSPKGGSFQQVTLDPATGEPVKRESRTTGGGNTLFGMHFALHYVSRDVGAWIVGVAAMVMFVAMLSGIVAHKKIFREFFTFRPGRGQQSWLDGHTTLAVTVLPFLLVMTWSGLIFSMFVYMPAAQSALYPGYEDLGRFSEEAFQNVPARHENRYAPQAPLTSLHNVLARAEEQWGEGNIARLRVHNPGRDDALIMVFSFRAAISGEKRLLFDGVTGEALDEPNRRTGPGAFYFAMLGLHEGYFATSYLRGLFVMLGFASAGLVATGLVRWSVKRDARLGASPAQVFGHIVVDALNVGAIIGLPVAIAAYFWANRLLPADMHGRAAWEAHILFTVWGLMFLYVAGRVATGARTRVWIEACTLAAAAFALIPILNAVTTQRHLGVTVPAGDWVLAALDLAAFVVGIFFSALARHMWLRHRQSSETLLTSTVPT
jgi:uncharacterized iron-regulated membrane protein